MSVFRAITVVVLVLLCGLLTPLLALSSVLHGEALSASQRELLQALPPAERRQALEALRQLGGEGSDSSASSVNESEEDRSAELSGAGSRLFREGDEAEAEERRAASGSSVVVTLTPKLELPSEELEALEADPVLRRLLGRGAFTLDESGSLLLPGLGVVPLLGLTERDMAHRLEAAPFFKDFEIEVRLLEMRAVGKAALKPFGYSLFERDGGSLTAPQSGPVPPDYVLGPGDSVRVQLFGNVNGIYEFEVTRDGVLNLPEIGPVPVVGLRFSSFREELQARVAETLIGTQVSVTMGLLRRIRVFVLGDVKRPGSYVVSGLSTISSALYHSGGISEVGSLRRIALKRSGRRVASLDLYDLLLSGDTSQDRRLQPGDVIFVPPLGMTVGVGGAVKRPGIYEVPDGASLGEALRLAGGLSPTAFAAGARLERIGADRRRQVLTVDVSGGADAGRRIVSGDVLLVPEVLPDWENTVLLLGHVQRPGPYEWSSGMRLTDLIGSPLELKPGVDDGYVLIRRERVRGEPIEVLSADLGAALRLPGSAEDIGLSSRDTVYVFSLDFGRQRVIAPLMEELLRQATFAVPNRRAEIVGDVRAPGEYPLEPGMRISDLIRAGGSLTEEAYTRRAELTRYTVENGEVRQSSVMEVDLEAVLRGDRGADRLLLAHDNLSITRVPEWDSEWSVTFEGEVRFPGEYRIRRGETLSSVLGRAGGMTSAAFPQGAIFLRESLEEREREQVEILARRLEADLTALSLASLDTSGAEALATGQALLEQLRGYEAVGRLVIDLEDLADGGRWGSAAVELRDGDRLLVPPKSQVVTVIGEVQQTTSHLHRAGLWRDDYIDLSGGLTRRADRKLIYVVRANGAVVAGKRSRWLGSGQRLAIEPGDTIVVPLETDRIRTLTFWTSVTQILYQGAIALSAVRQFSGSR